MFTHAATHRGAPFVGRRREIGILAHLIEEGIQGSLGLVRVAGEPGSGRRRLIQEALHHGPDAEWIHLAPAGVHADPGTWIDTELADLLDTYPDAPVPSWALHTLRGASGRRFHRRAMIPLRTPETLPRRTLADVLGASIGAVLETLTGQTLVIVDAGLWPDDDPGLQQTLWQVATRLSGAGAVMLAATGSSFSGTPDPPGVRTLEIGPLRARDLEELVDAAMNAGDPAALAGWLHRASRGSPFAVQEILRWLEELGHVRIDDERDRIDLLRPVERLPVPMNLRTVMEARYGRLPTEAVRLLHLILAHRQRREHEVLRRIVGPDDEEAFETGMAVLRRRAFLLHRHKRRPVALASPLWEAVVREGVERYTRHAHPAAVIVPRRSRAPGSPLAGAVRRLQALATDPDRDHRCRELARLWRLARRRPGPSWSSIRGRIALYAARERTLQGRNRAAIRWTERGLEGLTPDRQPNLRRDLLRFRVAALEQGGRSPEGDPWRAMALEEALRAGHLFAAASLRGVIAESRRRMGRLDHALEMAVAAETELGAMGLTARAELAAFTRTAALLDDRRLEEASEHIGRREADEDMPLWGELVRRLEFLEREPSLPVLDASHVKVPPGRWQWGLEVSLAWIRGRQALSSTPLMHRAGALKLFADRHEEIRPILRGAGHEVTEADLAEIRLRLAEETGRAREDQLVALLDRVAEFAGPHRLRHLAETLRGSTLADGEVYRRRLFPLLLEPVEPPGPRTEPVYILVMGRPRVVSGGSSWPLSLWPEWWLYLLVDVLVGEIFDEPVSTEVIEARLGEHEEVPGGDLESVVHEANEMLRGVSRIDGGFRLRAGRIEMNWSDLGCDARDVLANARSAERLHAAGDDRGAVALWDRSLAMVEGVTLPGLDAAPSDRLRAHLTHAVDRVMASRLEARAEVDAATLNAWREGPGRCVDVDRRLAEVKAGEREPSLSGPPPGSS